MCSQTWFDSDGTEMDLKGNEVNRKVTVGGHGDPTCPKGCVDGKAVPAVKVKGARSLEMEAPCENPMVFFGGPLDGETVPGKAVVWATLYSCTRCGEQGVLMGLVGSDMWFSLEEAAQ